MDDRKIVWHQSDFAYFMCAGSRLRTVYIVWRFQAMKRNKFFSLLFVVVLAAQCFPVSVFAQTDVTDTVVVEAVTQDQSAEVGDVTVENGDGVDVSAENGCDAVVTTEDIQASDTGIDASASGDGSSVTVETGGVTAGETGIEASADNGGSVGITTENIQSGDNGVTAEANGENSTVEVSTGTIDSGGTAIEAESSNGGSVEIKTEDIQSDGTGVTASGNGEGSSIDIKAGNITANGENEIISNSSSDGNEEFFVDKRSYGVNITNESGSAIEMTAKDIISGGFGVNVNNRSDEENSVNLNVGNITANGETIAIPTPPEPWLNGQSSFFFLPSYGLDVTNISSDYYSGEGNGHGNVGTVQVKTGDISSESNGLGIANRDGGTVIVESGDITANAEPIQDPYAWYVGDLFHGVNILNSGDSSTVQLTTGEIYSEGYGLKISNEGRGAVKVDAGTITANGGLIDMIFLGLNGVNIKNSGDQINTNWEQIHTDAGTVELNAGDVVSQSGGIRISNDQNGTVSVSAGNITAKEYGVDLENSGEGGAIDFKSGKVTTDGNGIEVSNNKNNSTLNVETEAITAGENGIWVSSSGENSTAVVKTGDITANGEAAVTTETYSYGSSFQYVSSQIYGAQIVNDSGDSIEMTTGDITSGGNGVRVSNRYDEDSTVTIETGNITANGEAIVTTDTYYGNSYQNVTQTYGADISNDRGGSIEMTAGDITSGGNGVRVSNQSDEKSTVSIEVGNITANGETTVTTNTRSDGSTYSYTTQSYGTVITNSDGGTVNFTAGDFISAANGIRVYNQSGLNATINTGNITANGEAIVTTNTYADGSTSSSVNRSYGAYIQNSSSSYQNSDGEWVHGNVGTIELTTEDIISNGSGIYVSNSDNGTVKIDVNGDITSNGQWGNLPQKYSDGSIRISAYDLSGASINSNSGGTTELTAENITAVLTGIAIRSSDENSIASAEINGNITANGDWLITTDTAADGSTHQTVHSSYGAAVLRSNNGGTSELTAGDINASLNGIYVYSSGENSNSSAKVGDITTNGEKITIPRTSSYIDADGDVHTFTYNAISTAYGVNIQSYDGGFSELMTGDVDSSGRGITAQSQGNGSSILLTVDGDINADDGIGLNSDNSMGFIEISVLGDVISSANGGLYSYTYDNGSTNVSVEGDVTSGNAAAVIFITSGESEANLSIGGNVNASGSEFGNGMNLNAANNGKTNVSVGGDVITEAENGVGLSVYARDDSVVDVLVAGTIAGDQVGVSLGETGSFEDGNREGYTTAADNLKLTVWQIELNEEGHAAESMNIRIDRANGVIMDREAVYGDEEQAFEQSILYIIKLEQPAEGAVLRATDGNGKALEKSHDYEVAHEGDTVLMKIDIQSGFELYGAYNGLGEKVSLLQDEQGNFYVEVPKGGGVYLSASLGRIPSGEGNYTPEEEDDDEENARKKMMKTAYYRQPAKKPIRQASGKPSAVFGAAAADAQEFTISYDLNGGHFTDPSESASFKAYTGQKHVMLEAPVREGFRFLYWADASLANSYPYFPGSWFTVGSSNMTFIAVWEQIK